jgi:predicted aconitase
MDLDAADRAALAGEHGQAARLAMELLVAMGRAEGAPHLIDIESAHIDGCLFHGRAGLDFAQHLVAGGGAVAVPTTLNVSSLDLIHPDLYKGDPATAAMARELIDAYLQLGCLPTLTCAPYQLAVRPGLGAQIAWGESNAIVFANSVLGARTNRYGDFMDICCAISGRAPYTGLHTDEGRRGTVVVELHLPDPLLDDELSYALLGHVLGQVAGTEVPVLVGLDPGRASEDRLKALGAAAASSGSVAMFHAVGSSPEAPTLEAALGDIPAPRSVVVDSVSLSRAREELTSSTGTLGAVSVGTPHMSLAELRALAGLVTDRRSTVPFYVNTGRDVLETADREGITPTLEAFGAILVTDTCTYVTAVMGELGGDLLTNSAKLAFYAPANLGATVTLGSLSDCVESAVVGRYLTPDRPS